MSDPAISLCTYTYNDAAFARGLVESVKEWTLRPDELVIVDDGSIPPFEAQGLPASARIIRLEPNRGITEAKRAGLCAARGEYIMSMDCDTRVAPDWLELNLAHVQRPGIGLVGGALLYASGRDLVSRYLSRFGDNHNLRHVGEVDFIPGNAFLLRRAVWEEIGGFGGYRETNCQDHALCRRMTGFGYKLFSNARARAWQLRRIPRTTLCKRVWKWCHKAVKAGMPGGGRLVPYLFEVLARPMISRFEDAVDLGEPLFIYVELLYLAHTVLDCLDHGLARGLATAGVRDGCCARVQGIFSASPRLWAVFLADLARIGRAWPESLEPDTGPWE
ncbi:MAG: glycosyltransferase family 2 protein, partial [Desulfovibrionaceae bacterium]|nr:glycosyltransferase family 2 protein [Desulfovibrionaceae bacterium]